MKTAFIYGLVVKGGEDAPFYIGKANCPKSRFYVHKNKMLTKHTLLYNKMKKMIKEGMEISYVIIDEVPVDDWQKWEIKYILLYKSFGARLYNTTNGGNGGFTKEMWENSLLATIKPILQYSFEGEFIREWDSASNATRHVGLGSHSCIGAVLTGKKPTAKNYQWRYKTDNYPLFIPSAQERIDLSWRKVFITIDGQTKKLSEWSEISGVSSDVIRQRYVRDKFRSREDLLGKRGFGKRSLKPPILQYDKSFNIVSEYISIPKAAFSTGISRSSIANNLNGSSKSAGGFIWKYKNYTT